MTTSTSTRTVSDLTSVQGASFLPWINRGLESLWLFMVFLIPLMFVDQDYVISEAKIAYVEIPKVALLRTSAALMALVWLIKWAITSRAFQSEFPSASAIAENLRPVNAGRALVSWLKVHPTRWLLLSAALFFGSTFISTVLSGSFSTSLWGEIPGQDGYSAYTIASYGVLFGGIATHLKTQAQLQRIFAAIVLMGSLVGIYAIFQHFGHDFLGITESSGGGTSRVTVFMGNAIFAAAVLSMTIPITLVAAAIYLRGETSKTWAFLSRFGPAGPDTAATLCWSLIMTVQLLGLMFTFSRGPWSGAVLALVVFLGLLAVAMGVRTLIRTGLVLGLAGILSIAFLHLQGSVSITGAGLWLGVVIALLGLFGVFVTMIIINRSGRTLVLIAAVGAVIAIVGVAVIAPSALSGRGSAESTSGEESGSAASLVGGRVSSIGTEVLGGFVGGRGTHWKVSWELIKNRPWFEFDDLHLTWLRPLVGYGPDLFRYTYLLESPGDGVRFFPLEPDHAHNFFIHQTVEQGLIGGIATLALFFSVFGIAGHHLFRRLRQNMGNPVYRLLLFGLMAVILGRFLEMMVGVARISDLTVLWVLFGLFAALVRFDDGGRETEELVSTQPAEPTNRRYQRRARRAETASTFSAGLIIRLAIVAWAIGSIGVVTWQKSVNSVRASVAEGRAVDHFQRGDFDSAVVELDNAIRLAPGVPTYYNNRAQAFLLYQLRSPSLTEPGCARQDQVPYLACLGVEGLESNLESVAKRPFYYRSRIAAGNTAFNLQLHESAVQYYSEALSMVPNAWKVKNDLAESQINTRNYDQALFNLEQTLLITGDSDDSLTALFLKGRALNEIGRIDEAIATLKHGISLSSAQVLNSARNLQLIRIINEERGVLLDIDHFDKVIEENPEDAVAYYLRGLAHLRFGDAVRANSDIDISYNLGFRLDEVRAHRGYSSLKKGDTGIDKALPDLTFVVEKAPSNGLFNAYYGELMMDRANYAEALNRLDIAGTLDPGLELVPLVRSKVYMALGLEEVAKQALDASASSDLPTPQDYSDRGQIHVLFGETDLAILDLDKAIQINPNRAKSYADRGKAYASMGDFDSALTDFNTALQIDSKDITALLNRGALNVILEEYDSAIADLNEIIIFRPNEARAYNVRAKAYEAIGNLESAVANFNDAVRIKPRIGLYYLDRAKIWEILGETVLSANDVEVAESLGVVTAPSPESFFDAYADTTTSEEDTRQLLALETERQALRDGQ